MSFTEWFGRHEEILGLVILFIVLANLILLTDFFSYDPQHGIKTGYYYGHSGSRIDNENPNTLWNRNIKFGMPQYDKVFWDKYPVLYLVFNEIWFFLFMVLLSSLGIYLFLRTARYNFLESLAGAFFYGVSFRFWGYLPVWIYGWKLVLLCLPWMAYAVRNIKNGGGLRYIILLAVSLMLCLMLFESELNLYIFLVLIIYLLYSFVDLIEYHNGVWHFFLFFLKVAAAIILAFASVIFPYWQLLSVSNFHILTTVQQISSFRLIIVITFSAGAFLLLRIAQKRLVLFLAVIILLAINMYVIIDKLPWLDSYDNESLQLVPESEIISRINQDTTSFRIYPVGRNFPDNRWTFNSESIGGFDFYQLNRYNQVIRKCLHSEIDKNLNINWNLLNITNVKYIISSVKIPSYRILYNFYSPSENLILYKLKNTPEYAWFAKELIQKEPEQILQLLNSPDSDFNHTAVMESIPPEFRDSTSLPKPLNSKIDITEISPEHITINLKNDNPGLLLVSEPYDEKGLWKAYIDSVETEIYPADYILRSVVVPPGTHCLEMKYDTSEYDTFKRLSYFSKILLLCLLISEMIYSGIIKKLLKKQ